MGVAALSICDPLNKNFPQPNNLHKKFKMDLASGFKEEIFEIVTRQASLRAFGLLSAQKSVFVSDDHSSR